MANSMHEQTIRAWVDAAWNRGEVDGQDHIYASSYSPTFLQEPSPHTLGGLKVFIRHFRGGMKDLRLEIQELVTEGDKVAWRFVASGTLTGELFGFAPTGRAGSAEGIVISR